MYIFQLSALDLCTKRGFCTYVCNREPASLCGFISVMFIHTKIVQICTPYTPFMHRLFMYIHRLINSKMEMETGSPCPTYTLNECDAMTFITPLQGGAGVPIRPSSLQKIYAIFSKLSLEHVPSTFPVRPQASPYVHNTPHASPTDPDRFRTSTPLAP